MQLTQLQKEIMSYCSNMIKEKKEANNNEPLDIRYSDYLDYCFDNGGVSLRAMFAELLRNSTDDEQGDFYDCVTFECDRVNRGFRYALGSRIKELRQSQNLTELEFAERAGIREWNVRSIEAGKYSIRVDMLDRVVTALGCRALIEYW